jgi:hypothetical protein
VEDDYYINLEKYSLSDYAKELKNSELFPSRKILQEETKERFSRLNKVGIKNLNDVLSALNTKNKRKTLAKELDVPEDFLVILVREVKGFQPKPVKLCDFPNILKTTVKKLESIGIKNTKQLFDFVKTKNKRITLSKKIDVSYDEILELTKLTDVARIRWVGAKAARLFVDSTYDTVKKISNADYKKLTKSLIKINDKKKHYKGKFRENDIRLCILAARTVPDVIIY